MVKVYSQKHTNMQTRGSFSTQKLATTYPKLWDKLTTTLYTFIAVHILSLCVLPSWGVKEEGEKGPPTLLAAHASDWMEPIINQEQFLPIIQQEPGEGKRKKGCLLLQLSVGDEGRSMHTEWNIIWKTDTKKAFGNWDKAESGGSVAGEMREWRKAVKYMKGQDLLEKQIRKSQAK